jgi:hypothetical protein
MIGVIGPSSSMAVKELSPRDPWLKNLQCSSINAGIESLVFLYDMVATANCGQDLLSNDTSEPDRKIASKIGISENIYVL